MEGRTLDNMGLARGWDGLVVTLRGEIGAAASPVSVFVTLLLSVYLSTLDYTANVKIV